MKNLDSFLQLGYFLDYQNKDISMNISNIDKLQYKDIPELELISIGSKLLQESISFNFKNNQKHLVPISGGLDSRAILAGLLEHTEAKNIYTYTFGTPNTLDFDIGNFIAKKLGTKHISYDLTQYQYKMDELLDISNRIDKQTVLFHHPSIWQIDERFIDFTLWSGFMGDPIFGSHLPSTISSDIDKAESFFIKKNKYVHSINLAKDINFKDLIQCNCISKTKLSLEEQLDFQNRQTKFIAPHVLMKGFEYKTPFLYQLLVDFALSVDNKYRKDQYLYKKILLNTFPKEFSYKTKTNYGLPLGVSNNRIFIKKVQNKILKTIGLSKGLGINYLDFNEKIRTKKDLKEIVSMNILDLKQRNIIDWIDIEQILNNHLLGKGNHADALIILSSLEIHLKNGLKL